MIHGQLKLFAGSAHPALAREIAEHLGIPARRGAPASVSGHRSLVSDRREHPRDRRLHRAADVGAGGRAPGRVVRDDRRVPAIVGVAHHGRDSVLRLRAAGPQGQAARADFGQAGGKPAQRRGHESRADDGPAQGADSGVLRYPGGPPVRGAGDHRLPGAAELRAGHDRVAGRRGRRARARVREAARRRPRDRRQTAQRRRHARK